MQIKIYLNNCPKFTCSSKTVVFSTKLNQFAPNFFRVKPRHMANSFQLARTITATAIKKYILKQRPIKKITHF